MFRLVIALLRQRATWRFLAVLLIALGYSAIAQDLSGLEVALCSVLSCVD